ncbi:trithorax group protein osa-like isoform X2 [Populus alba x Populus x berolinensis]|nr:trithorax group protein osa-like isoform X2 [Populus alba x Populus x berolinensis]
MASGSSGRANSGSKGFDFGTDDILCSYEDYGTNNQDSSNGSHSDPVIGSNSSKDFHKSKMTRSSVYPASSYSQPEDSFHFSPDVVSSVEKGMKKHTDNIMRFLEGISSRLSQLELSCYNLDKAIGDMRSDSIRDNEEADLKLKSLEKHIQEVHRSVQILRDKQELAETQKELAKLQLAQKEPSSSSQSQSNEEKATPAASDPKATDNASDIRNQQLALALPHHVAPQQHAPPVPPPSQTPPQNVTQQQSYYLPPAQLPTPAAPIQHPQNQYLPSDPQYRTPQMQDVSRVAPQPAQPQVNQTLQGQQFPQYQQQWPQQLPLQVQPPQQTQPQIKPPSTTAYTPYQPPCQPTNPSPQETLPNSLPMQVSYSGVPQSLASRADTMPYGYGAGRTAVPQQPRQPSPQQIKGTFGGQHSDAYATAGPHPGQPPVSAYMVYDGEGGRTHHPPQQSHFPQGGYPPQPAPGTGMLPRHSSPSHFFRNHPYSDLIEKLVSMGFRGDHAASVIQRMEESGEPVDFNAVLDRLNVQSSGGSQRGGWSG